MARRPLQPVVPVADSARDWLHVPVLETAGEAVSMAQLAAKYRADARSGRWTGLLSALAEADSRRAAAPDGTRLTALISAAARTDVGAALGAADLTAAALATARLDEVARAYPRSPGAAHLVAAARLDLAAAHRAAAMSGDLNPGHLAAARDETAEAARLIDLFDPIEHDSPLMAATRYALVGQLEEAEALWEDWYEDWIDLDPADPAPHLAHARHLLPQWFGTLAGFDAAARGAARRTADVTGAAAYALHALSAHEVLGRMPPGLDEGLFLRGLDDHARALGTQTGANRVAAALADHLHSTTDPQAAAATRRALDRHLRARLREFHLPLWSEGEACVRWALEQCYGPALAAGGRVVSGAAGLTVEGG